MKNTHLDRIFDDIILKYEKTKESDFQGIPVRDGIIDEELFEKQKERILIICKDHNNRHNISKDVIHDFRNWWHEPIIYLFSHRIASWVIHILNDFKFEPHQLVNSEKENALKKLAFLNIKKISGTHKISNDHLNKFIDIGKSHINKQIAIINPTIIICCLHNIGQTEKLLDVSLTLKDGVAFGTKENAKVVNFFHPSARKNNLDLLKHLEKALNF